MTSFRELIGKDPDIGFVIHTRSAEETEEPLTDPAVRKVRQMI